MVSIVKQSISKKFKKKYYKTWSFDRQAQSDEHLLGEAETIKEDSSTILDTQEKEYNIHLTVL